MPNFMRHDLIWIDEELPYVVTQQHEPADGFLDVAQCLAPEKSKESRVTTRIEIAKIIKHEKPILLADLLADEQLQEFDPDPISVLSGLPIENLIEIYKLCLALEEEQLDIRVFGSASWQHLTQRQYTNENSDVDLLLYLANLKQLNALDKELHHLQKLMARRIDGELVLAHQYFVAWREWYDDNDDILVKTNHKTFLINKQELLQQCMTSPSY